MLNTENKHDTSIPNDNLVSLPQRKSNASDTQAQSNPSNIKRLVRHDGKADFIEPSTMADIYNGLYAKADELAAQHGLVCARVIKSFDDNSADVKLKFSVVDLVGVDVFARNYFEKAEKYGFKPADYGKRFIADNVEYMITGLDDTDPNDVYIRLLRATDEGSNRVTLTTTTVVKKALLLFERSQNQK